MKIYTESEIDKIYLASQLAAKCLFLLQDKIVPGITTQEIDNFVFDFVTSQGGVCACLNYKGFPKSCCTSVNNVVCHGIPTDHVVLKSGDIINVDIVVKLDGYHGDTSRMFCVGKVNFFAKQLIDTTYNAMMAGIEAIKIGEKVNVIGEAIENYCNSLDIAYGIVENYCGHGVGENMHEQPHIFHQAVTHYDGPIIQPGMCFTVEPMINAGKKEVKTLLDKWTVVTKDRSLSAQWEHTVAVTKSGYKILSSYTE